MLQTPTSVEKLCSKQPIGPYKHWRSLQKLFCYHHQGVTWPCWSMKCQDGLLFTVFLSLKNHLKASQASKLSFLSLPLHVWNRNEIPQKFSMKPGAEGNETNYKQRWTRKHLFPWHWSKSLNSCHWQLLCHSGVLQKRKVFIRCTKGHNPYSSLSSFHAHTCLKGSSWFHQVSLKRISDPTLLWMTHLYLANIHREGGRMRDLFQYI